MIRSLPCVLLLLLCPIEVGQPVIWMAPCILPTVHHRCSCPRRHCQVFKVSNNDRLLRPGLVDSRLAIRLIQCKLSDKRGTSGLPSHPIPVMFKYSCCDWNWWKKVQPKTKNELNRKLFRLTLLFHYTHYN